MQNHSRGGINALHSEAFTGIYAEIAEEIDSETAVKIFELLRGQAVIFPQRLFNCTYVRDYIRTHSEEYSVRELARMFGYSDRRIRQFIAEERAEEDAVQMKESG